MRGEKQRRGCVDGVQLLLLLLMSGSKDTRLMMTEKISHAHTHTSGWSENNSSRRENNGTLTREFWKWDLFWAALYTCAASQEKEPIIGPNQNANCFSC